MYIDTHCHLDFAVFESTLSAQLPNWIAQGISRYIVPSLGPENWQRVADLCAAYPHCFAAFGCHPLFLSELAPPNIEALATFVTQPTCVAIGEVGLDITAAAAMPFQESVFLSQTALAAKYGLPLLIHSRKTHDRIVKLLTPYRQRVTGVIHGFSGSQQQAQQFIQLGFKLGVGGVITYPRANKTRHAIAAMPLDSLVLETDSPDMPAARKQGRVNTPETVIQVVESLCEIRAESREHIIKQLWANAIQVFPLLARV